MKKTPRLINAIIIAITEILLLCLTACATPYQSAQKSFFQASQSYLDMDYEDALIRYCHALNQLESNADTDPASRLLKASIYHRFYLMDARNIYHKTRQKKREQYSLFANLLSKTENNEFLDLAFQELLAAEKNIKNTNTQTFDKLLIIQRNLILGDKLSLDLDRENKNISPTQLSLPEEFIKTVNAYGYGETIKSLYLNAWASALAQTRKNAPTAEPARTDNETLYKLAEARLQHIYYSLSNTTANLQTPAFRRINRHYQASLNRIKSGILGEEISIFTTSSPEEAASGLLNETLSKNYPNLNPENYLAEARSQMRLAIEMIVANKPDKAETHLLNALKNCIIAKELSNNLPEISQSLIGTTMNNIYLNLYRISIVASQEHLSGN